jgi:hypothetical protein
MMEKIKMRTHNSPKTFLKRSVTWTVAVVAGAIFAATPGVAQQSAPRTFASPQQASNALFRAVEDNDEQSVEAILGAGKEITSSNDEAEDRLEREQFRKKYQEMHRLVKEPDGTRVLYIGAENWPFPVPLEVKNGRWSFDSEAGLHEIQFRRIGENETTAIHVCTNFGGSKQGDGTDAAANNIIERYALSLMNTADSDSRAETAQTAKPPSIFHGYYFQTLAKTSGRKNSDAVILVAYPIEYRSTGVMTFIVTQSGRIYERDLGPKTETSAKTVTAQKPNSSWHAVQAAELTMGR